MDNVSIATAKIATSMVMILCLTDNPREMKVDYRLLMLSVVLFPCF